MKMNMMALRSKNTTCSLRCTYGIALWGTKWEGGGYQIIMVNGVKSPCEMALTDSECYLSVK